MVTPACVSWVSGVCWGLFFCVFVFVQGCVLAAVFYSGSQGVARVSVWLSHPPQPELHLPGQWVNSPRASLLAPGASPGSRFAVFRSACKLETWAALKVLQLGRSRIRGTIFQVRLREGGSVAPFFLLLIILCFAENKHIDAHSNYNLWLSWWTIADCNKRSHVQVQCPIHFSLSPKFEWILIANGHVFISAISVGLVSLCLTIHTYLPGCGEGGGGFKKKERKKTHPHRCLFWWLCLCTALARIHTQAHIVSLDPCRIRSCLEQS